MYGMLQRHAAQVLLSAGVVQERIHELTGMSERTVRRIGREAPIGSAAADGVERQVGAPSKVGPFRDVVASALKENPELKSVEIFHRMKQRGYQGRRSAAYALIASLRRTKGRYVMRFDGLAGEFTQHDFGEVVVTFRDGRKKKIHFFASRLKYSRWMHVTLVPNQKAETLVRELLEHFWALGGMPLLAIFDRPKTIALEWRADGTVTKWNKTFADATFRVGVTVELCWAHSPQQKGSVENLVGWVKGSFFSQRRFLDYEDVLMQLSEWLNEVNNDRPCRATGVTPAERLPADLERLRPPRIRPEDFDLLFDAGIGPTAEVSFEGAVYSMPPEAIGFPAELHVHLDRIRIVAGRFSAVHPRLAAGQRSCLPEHRQQQLAAVSGRRGKRYLKRQHILELGEAAVNYLSEVVHRRPDRWYQDVEIMHAVLQDQGEEVLRNAIQRALRDEVYGGEYVRTFAENTVAVIS